MSQSKILVSDEVSDSGLEPLRAAGFLVEKRTGLSPDQLADALQGCEGLVVRSETRVTDALLSNAPQLKVVGRAGVGVDNIDVASATSRGIVVMNAPDGNTITTSEHTMALLIALARSVPQANSSLRSGLWERKRFIGVELQGKTLGIIGLGRIGRAVASRARAFGMTSVAFDPFIAPEQARDSDIELVQLDELFARADFITIHTPLTAETRGVIGHNAFARMKKGVRIINCARGGLVDEGALYDAIKSGTVAGAALDVFDQEPPATDHPLLLLDEVIATPHLGASTAEAQEGVAFTVAEQMRDYLLSGALRGAVNVPSLGTEEFVVLRPYIELAEKLGRFQAQLVESAILEVKLEFANETVEGNTAAVLDSFLAGLLHDVSARVTAVNASLIAKERGIDVTTTNFGAGSGFFPAIRTHVIAHNSEQAVAGAIFAFGDRSREGRITEINGIPIEAIASGHLIITHSQDVPGVIGLIGGCLGSLGINISRFHLGRQEAGGEALAVIQTDESVSDAGLAALSSLEHVLTVRRVEL